MARTIAMLRPLCFAKWDKIFYFSGQQWLGVPDRFTNCRVRDGDRHGDAGVALLGAVDVDCDVDRGCSRSRLTFSFPYLLPSSLATVVPMSGSHICHLRCVRAYGRQTRRGIDAWSVSRLTGLLDVSPIATRLWRARQSILSVASKKAARRAWSLCRPSITAFMSSRFLMT